MVMPQVLMMVTRAVRARPMTVRSRGLMFGKRQFDEMPLEDTCGPG